MAKSSGRGGARKGSGRKPIAREERRRNRVVISFTDAEVDELEAAAAAAPAAVYCREVVLRHLAAKRRKR